MFPKNRTAKTTIALAFVVAMAGLGYFLFYFNTAQHHGPAQVDDSIDRSLAVLPFANMNSDPSKQYFSEGLTEGILQSLATIKGLKVTARSSAFTFRGEYDNIKEVGQALGVRTVLEGSVEQHEDSIRILMHLIDVADNLVVWSGSFDERVNDVFALQWEIAHKIAMELQINVALNQGSVLERPKMNTEAYQLYLLGRASWNRRTPKDLLDGIGFFERAVALDPSFGEAYAGMANCYVALGYGSHLAPKEAFPKAIEAAMKALTLDSSLSAPHAILGFCRFYYDWDWSAAEQEFRKAISLNPNDELGFAWYGYYLTAMERYDEARIMLGKAAALDPLSAPIFTDLGFSLYYGKEYNASLKALHTALEMNPSFPLAHLWLGRVYQANRQYSEAVDEYLLAMKGSPEWPVALAQIGNAYGAWGRNQEAKIVLEQLKALYSRKFVTAYGMALVYSGLGDQEQAIEWLQTAYNERSHWLVWLKTDPRWAVIQGDKRFQDLLARIGLPAH